MHSFDGHLGAAFALARESELILGVDVFDAHAAVIDYPTQSLFLKAVPADPGAGS